MKKILLNISFALLAFAVFYSLGRELFRNWEQISVYSFHLNIPLMILGAALYALAFFIFSAGWYFLLRYLEHPIPFYYALLYFLITQPAKYIPGKIWLPVTRMKFCKPHGVPNTITLLVTGIEGVLEILAGSYISLVAILQSDVLGDFSLWGTLIITGIGLVLLYPPIFYFFINLYLKIVRREPLHKKQWVPFKKLLFLQINYAGGMLCLGLSQLAFLQALTPVDIKHVPFLISVGAFSYVASILAVFTPGGLGVREGVWYLALKGITAPHIALIYAFASRLWTIIAEALLLFISLPILWHRTRKTARQEQENVITGV